MGDDFLRYCVAVIIGAILSAIVSSQYFARDSRKGGCRACGRYSEPDTRRERLAKAIFNAWMQSNSYDYLRNSPEGSIARKLLGRSRMKADVLMADLEGSEGTVPLE